MTTVMEMFFEDRLAHPFVPHVFVVPRLMTHQWRKALSKDADLLFTVPCGFAFWSKDMHEPLIVAVVLPCSFVDGYHGPWVAQGTAPFEALENFLRRGLRLWKRGEPEKLFDLEGKVQMLWETKEEWLWAVLLEFLAAARDFPPVRECVVRKLFYQSSGQPIPHSRERGPTRRQDADCGFGGHGVQVRKRRCASYGRPI